MTTEQVDQLIHILKSIDSSLFVIMLFIAAIFGVYLARKS